jgi:hypothetical protein
VGAIAASSRNQIVHHKRFFALVAAKIQDKNQSMNRNRNHRN